MARRRRIYTIGHSTHDAGTFIDLLRRHGVEQVVDIRTIPRSRRNPQFERDTLERSLHAAGIAYRHMRELGGLRHPRRDSVNTGWRNASFRGYADYMQTDEFAQAIDGLLNVSRGKSTAIMCAEALPWRCHRSLVGDALLARGIEVVDILSDGHARPHELTHFAKVDGPRITYPADLPDLPLLP